MAGIVPASDVKDQNGPDGPLTLSRVDRTYRQVADHLQHVRIRSAEGQEQTLQTTDEHPFFVIGKGWTKAEELAAGDLLQEPDGSTSTVLSSIREEHPEGLAVFNLRVANTHSYFVRAEGSTAQPVWVHNAGAGYEDVRNNITPAEYEKLCFGGPGTKQSFDIWGSDSGFSRIPDDFVKQTGTIREASLQRWSEMNLEDPLSLDSLEFNRKLGQAEADGWLLNNNRNVNEAIWHGPEPLPTTGRAAELTLKLKQLGIKYKVVPI